MQPPRPRLLSHTAHPPGPSLCLAPAPYHRLNPRTPREGRASSAFQRPKLRLRQVQQPAGGSTGGSRGALPAAGAPGPGRPRLPVADASSPPAGAALGPVGLPGGPPLPPHGRLLPAHPVAGGRQEQGAAAVLALPARRARARPGGAGLSPPRAPEPAREPRGHGLAPSRSTPDMAASPVPLLCPRTLLDPDRRWHRPSPGLGALHLHPGVSAQPEGRTGSLGEVGRPGGALWALSTPQGWLFPLAPPPRADVPALAVSTLGARASACRYVGHKFSNKGPPCPPLLRRPPCVRLRRPARRGPQRAGLAGKPQDTGLVAAGSGLSPPVPATPRPPPTHVPLGPGSQPLSRQTPAPPPRASAGLVALAVSLLLPLPLVTMFSVPWELSGPSPGLPDWAACC